jgi:hypothetical protein
MEPFIYETPQTILPPKPHSSQRLHGIHSPLLEVNVRNTLDSKWTTKVEGMSSCSIFKWMKVENLTPSPSLDLGGLEIWSYGKNETKSEWIKKYYKWTIKNLCKRKMLRIDYKLFTWRSLF